MILIFSAPSGSGKSTLVNYLLSERNDLEFSISATTRQPRGQEQNGREYYFITPEEFEDLIRNDRLVEYENVYSGTSYGTLKSEIERIERSGHHVVFDVDVKGGINLKRIFGDRALSVFVCPPSVDELRRRLVGPDNPQPALPKLIDDALRVESQHALIFLTDSHALVVAQQRLHIYAQMRVRVPTLPFDFPVLLRSDVLSITNSQR